MPRKSIVLAIWLTLAMATAKGAEPAAAQAPPLDSLVQRALAVSPAVTAMRHRVEASRARVAHAGTLPDPMLGIGIMNLPVTDPGFGDFMTMATVAASQTLPYPGKLPIARRAEEMELVAAEARVAAAQLEVGAEVRKAYYELAFLDRVIEALGKSQQIALTLLQIAESRYGVGAGAQLEVLEARVAAARPPEEAILATEERRDYLAKLNALLDRPSSTPLDEPSIPERIARAAVPEPGGRVSFTSAALGARATDSPLPSLDEFQEQALRANPSLRAHEATIAAQQARVELARKGRLPDLDVSLQLGIRVNHSDMVSFMVSAPVPLRAGERQDEQLAEARAELSALGAEHHSMRNWILADVAASHSEVERARAQLALLTSGVLPYARAAVDAATTAFQVGRSELEAVLESQSALNDFEVAYFRALADFAQGLAEMERVVGAGVLP